jgi:transketolase C-terminal domain/subunit
VNVSTIKPLDRETLLASARKTGVVVTAEEHQIINGLGSAVCELLSEELPTPVVRVDDLRPLHAGRWVASPRLARILGRFDSSEEGGDLLNQTISIV